MKWGLTKMKVGDCQFFEYNEYTKRDIKSRLNTMVFKTSKSSGMEFKVSNVDNGAFCERIA